jgi:hypothetical protein
MCAASRLQNPRCYCTSIHDLEQINSILIESKTHIESGLVFCFRFCDVAKRQ